MPFNIKINDFTFAINFDVNKLRKKINSKYTRFFSNISLIFEDKKFNINDYIFYNEKIFINLEDTIKKSDSVINAIKYNKEQLDKLNNVIRRSRERSEEDKKKYVINEEEELKLRSLSIIFKLLMWYKITNQIDTLTFDKYKKELIKAIPQNIIIKIFNLSKLIFNRLTKNKESYKNLLNHHIDLSDESIATEVYIDFVNDVIFFIDISEICTPYIISFMKKHIYSLITIKFNDLTTDKETIENYEEVLYVKDDNEIFWYINSIDEKICDIIKKNVDIIEKDWYINISNNYVSLFNKNILNNYIIIIYKIFWKVEYSVSELLKHFNDKQIINILLWLFITTKEKYNYLPYYFVSFNTVENDGKNKDVYFKYMIPKNKKYLISNKKIIDLNIDELKREIIEFNKTIGENICDN